MLEVRKAERMRDDIACMINGRRIAMRTLTPFYFNIALIHSVSRRAS